MLHRKLHDMVEVLSSLEDARAQWVKTIGSKCFSSIPLDNLEIWPSLLQPRKLWIKIICTVKWDAGVMRCKAREEEEEKKNSPYKLGSPHMKAIFADICSVCCLFTLPAVGTYWIQPGCGNSVIKTQQQRLYESVQCCWSKPPLWAKPGMKDLSKPTSLKTPDTAAHLMSFTLLRCLNVTNDVKGLAWWWHVCLDVQLKGRW